MEKDLALRQCLIRFKSAWSKMILNRQLVVVYRRALADIDLQRLRAAVRQHLAAGKRNLVPPAGWKPALHTTALLS